MQKPCLVLAYCIKGKVWQNLTKVGTFFLKKITFFVEVLQKQTKESVVIGMLVYRAITKRSVKLCVGVCRRTR